jgi:hypothetical protein
VRVGEIDRDLHVFVGILDDDQTVILDVSLFELAFEKTVQPLCTWIERSFASLKNATTFAYGRGFVVAAGGFFTDSASATPLSAIAHKTLSSRDFILTLLF